MAITNQPPIHWAIYRLDRQPDGTDRRTRVYLSHEDLEALNPQIQKVMNEADQKGRDALEEIRFSASETSVIYKNRQVSVRKDPGIFHLLSSQTRAQPKKREPKPEKFAAAPYRPSLKLERRPLSAARPFGSANESGNDCFLNAALQLILSDAELIKKIIQTEDPRLQELIDFLTQPGGSVLSGAAAIRKCLNQIARTTDFSYGQHDSPDAYNRIMRYLTETHPELFEDYLGTETIDRRTSRTHGDSGFSETEDSSEVQRGPFYIPITVTGTADLQTYLNAYFKYTHFPEAEAETIQQTVRTSWASNPRRFTVLLGGGYSAERTRVNNPEFLTINGIRYQLVAYSVHYGDIEGGHWTAARCITAADGTKKYFNLNDSRVSPCSRESFLKQAEEQGRMLVYERIDPII